MEDYLLSISLMGIFLKIGPVNVVTAEAGAIPPVQMEASATAAPLSSACPSLVAAHPSFHWSSAAAYSSLQAVSLAYPSPAAVYLLCQLSVAVYSSLQAVWSVYP
jgi:hypothetical protein